MTSGKRAVIVCSQDPFANGVKPKEIEKYLKSNGYDSVLLFNSGAISRLGGAGIRRRLPGLNVKKVELYLCEGLLVVLSKFGTSARRAATSLLLWRVLVLRGQVLGFVLRSRGNFDLLICESNLDTALTLADRIADVQILDLPSPFAEEQLFGGLLSQAGYERVRKVEIAAYAAADYLSFHWHTYADYVRDKKYQGNNFLALTYGTNPKLKLAKYDDHPKIVYLGFLGDYWVNLPLLAQLCKLCPHLEVYGGPEPPASLGINYKGYAPSTDVVANYQFGLVTISDDELRRHSFSSKHLEYASYGLPVLTPVWRKDEALCGSSIYYTAENFLAQVRGASMRQEWERLHAAALKDAERFSWPSALKALDFQPRPS
ncbi:hypothetical protein [Caballeronia terrestris]|nr:hypothetical protein [Caballeronia terrestris]